MLKKILLTGFVLFSCNVLLSLISCEPDDDIDPYGGGGGCVQQCFQSDSAWITAYNVSSNMNIQPTNNNTATNVRLDMHLENGRKTCFNSNKRSELLNMSFINKAYAYTPAICNITPFGNDSIVSYNIYSNNNYNANHPAGTSLNDIFDNLSLPLEPLESYEMEERICSFKINTLPADSGTHVFTVDIVQLDGDVLTVHTTPIRVNKP